MILKKITISMEVYVMLYAVIEVRTGEILLMSFMDKDCERLIETQKRLFDEDCIMVKVYHDTLMRWGNELLAANEKEVTA